MTLSNYYKANWIEVIDFINAYDLSFSLGNVVKYIARARHKNGEDRKTVLYKALSYLQYEIALEEKKKESSAFYTTFRKKGKQL